MTRSIRSQPITRYQRPIRNRPTPHGTDAPLDGVRLPLPSFRLRALRFLPEEGSADG
jgi:hypothetical protein